MSWVPYLEVKEMEKLIENYVVLKTEVLAARSAIPRNCPFREMAPTEYAAWERAYQKMCDAALEIAEHVVEWCQGTPLGVAGP
jgi:hypothetical protein